MSASRRPAPRTASPGAGAAAPASRPPRRPTRPVPPPDPARAAALACLRAVDERGAYANLVLPGLLRESGLHGRDAGFATELAYGTLRRRGTWDAVLAACAGRPLSAVDPPVLDALRLGAHQLLGGLRVPPHAAVSSTVDLVRGVAPAAAGFANAVLRRAGERDVDSWVEILTRGADRADRLALAWSHPRWVVQAYADALGDWAEVEAALSAGNAAPSVHLAARPGLLTAGELAAESGGQVGRYSPYAVVLDGGDPADLASVREGRAAVQDEGSQLVALALAAADLDARDARWLDACAGPGGKAGLLAAVADQRGARVVAADRAAHRARLVASATRGLPVAVVTADATAPPWPDGAFDRVLLDAPCTGLGALRRRPEARWRRQPGDVAVLRALQGRLLDAAVASTRPGGVLAYVTCSPHPAETTSVVRAALRRNPGVAVEDARGLLPGVPDLGDGPYVQLWPHRHGTDAMFLALLRVR